MSGNTGGVGVRVTFIMQDSASVSGNTAVNGGGGVYGDGGLQKTGGTIYGSDAEQNLRNRVTGRNAKGHAIQQDDRWRNITAGPTMNPETYGFWLND